MTKFSKTSHKREKKEGLEERKLTRVSGTEKSAAHSKG
jgi:hypothetical protein